MDQLGHAIVTGGSIAGLIAARFCSDYFEQVTIIERDEIEDRPVIHKSVPRFMHSWNATLQSDSDLLYLSRRLRRIVESHRGFAEHAPPRRC